MVLAACTATLVALAVWAAVGASVSAGSDRQAQADPIEVFTFVDTGIVYVDPDTSEIIWQNEQRDRKTIGRDPWWNAERTDGETTPIQPWGEHREIVGNPDHDIVAWVETENGRRGDIVVVEAHTGDVLARAPIKGPSEDSVIISSVDDEAVYFAVVEQNWPFPDIARDNVRVWRWAAGEEPQGGLRPSVVYLNDLSAGVTASYVHGGVLFEDAEQQTASIARPQFPVYTDFGGALSPDGRYWYASKGSQVVETTTGRVIDLPTGRERVHGWISADELALIVCDTRECRMHTCDVGRTAGGVCTPGLRWAEAAEGSPYGLCRPYGLACGSRMPVL
ncbi:MAG: hypothetical protein M3116_07365 [Actinomycetota bacterium]|nr:hypothetical protein [Actinomycetota bacterium]